MQGTHKSKKSSKYRCLKISNFSFVIDEKKEVHRLLRHTSLDMVVRVSAAYLSPSLAFTCALTSVLSVSLMKGIPAVWSKM